MPKVREQNHHHSYVGILLWSRSKDVISAWHKDWKHGETAGLFENTPTDTSKSHQLTPNILFVHSVHKKQQGGVLLRLNVLFLGEQSDSLFTVKQWPLLKYLKHASHWETVCNDFILSDGFCNVYKKLFTHKLCIKPFCFAFG